MIQCDSLGHINVVVDDIERATDFYVRAFGAVPMQDIPRLRNVGIAKAGGFLDRPEEVETAVRFLRLPTRDGLTLELMQYHHPIGPVCCENKVANARGCVGHIALRVRDVDAAFKHLKATSGMRMINPSPKYRPCKVSKIKPAHFRLCDEKREHSRAEKQRVAETMSRSRYFYCVDPYGVQWQIEQGHTDVGSTRGRGT